MNDKLLDDFKKNYFEEFGYYIMNNKEINKKNNITITFIICVDKVNSKFYSYVCSNVEQFHKRFDIPIGISFGSKQLYIPPQKEGIYRGKYNKLKKEVLEIFNLEEEKK